MNKQEIISVLSELNKISGFRVSLLGSNFEEIAAFPEEQLSFCNVISSIDGERTKCAECSINACKRALEIGGTYICKCRYGLIEAVSPLYNFGLLSGFLTMGQVADSEDDATEAIRLLKSILGDDEESQNPEIAVINKSMTESYVSIMTICARYLTISNFISGTKPTVAEMARKYISENIKKRIVIGDICDALKCSKSTLLTGFKKQYGITVNSYITELRLDMAVRLLGEGRMTINEIASETGFSDQSYFSKVFSAKYGIPPSEYRSETRGM